jgi:hypothetical protein
MGGADRHLASPRSAAATPPARVADRAPASGRGHRFRRAGWSRRRQRAGAECRSTVQPQLIDNIDLARHRWTWWTVPAVVRCPIPGRDHVHCGGGRSPAHRSGHWREDRVQRRGRHLREPNRWHADALPRPRPRPRLVTRQHPPRVLEGKRLDRHVSREHRQRRRPSLRRGHLGHERRRLRGAPPHERRPHTGLVTRRTPHRLPQLAVLGAGVLSRDLRHERRRLQRPLDRPVEHQLFWVRAFPS